ncbi:sulfatase-like hydrolase/transferase [Aromatoleum petrolei]|uniref:Sulfatase-like hydrolase/transferase n=1 Tax=Aromatoleum petrolei TaxID=76116 RepID=A0ABX1MUP6_9RHOO|nr:sulfatase-like hydrolase/transferase [Aromatoleum petrolei]NMF91488.1 sulfatase-like hydrolase/transferase [Aromatoleum petrolei]QTQ35589.1 Putative sulfatase [Aromatoleum petrolei]
MSALPSSRQLNAYFLVTWLVALAQLFSQQGAREYASLAVAGWTLAATLSYAFMYVLPSLALGHALRRLLDGRRTLRSAPAVLAAAMIVLTGLTQVLLFADRVIHEMYGFHINGFVVNLVFTPGGIASLGASRSTELTAGAIILALCALQAAAWLWLTRPRAGTTVWRLRGAWAVALFIMLTTGERIAYGYSEMSNYQPILFASERFPLYQPLTFRNFAQKLGFKVDQAEARSMQVREESLSYPQQPLRVTAPERPLNIVWLVAESLRFDMLDPKIMPRLWAFSNDALRLEKHFSGGNMTQMGVFSMFYGLYGNYWFPMLAARRAPVLMDVLQQQQYQFSLNTSQRFTYPAFDKTVFANMRAEDLHPLEGGAPAWQRDVRNIDALINFIDKRDPARPFMTYMFFESTHANYDYPPEAEIAKPVLQDFNYLTADFGLQIGQIKNRYINAAHHVDSQIGRMIDHLEKRGLLENTIVIVLGDHGEEFMERSRWGHSAEFNRFQTSTPAVIRVPSRAPRVVTGITSHLDIPATLMPLLGVQNPPEDYSLGHDLLSPDYHRDYAVAADWNRLAYIGDDVKVTFPVNAIGAVRNEATDGDDHPLASADEAIASIRSAMVEIMANLARFSRHRG